MGYRVRRGTKKTKGGTKKTNIKEYSDEDLGISRGEDEK
jgi:hypothetical protein